MEFKDLVITPVYIFIIFLFAYIVRMGINNDIKKFFIPALTVKIIGAISVGLIYQFYYKGGDTFNYFHDSALIWKAFLNSPLKALKLIFADGKYHPDTFIYSSQIFFYTDLPSYFVVRLAGIFDILTFHTYTATAVLFALASFSGVWAMFVAFHFLFPNLKKELAFSVLFIPSVFFWGSGILKDTITLGALGWAFWALVQIFMKKRNFIMSSFILLLSFYFIYSIKIYILLCFLPAAIIWIFSLNIYRVRSFITKILITPVFLSLAIFFSYLAIQKVGEDDARYSLTSVTKTAEETARWLSYVSEKQGGSAYSLGDFDYSPKGMLKKFPLAVNVTLFRPYLWEARNPVMILSAIESFATFIFTLFVIFKTGLFPFFRNIFKSPVSLFCLIFSITFAFAVGFSTYNFGSLVRYKIPLIPFYIAGLFILKSMTAPSIKKTLITIDN